MKLRRNRGPKVRLSDLCHTSQAGIERIINSAPVPPGTVPGWTARTGRTESRRGRSRS